MRVFSAVAIVGIWTGAVIHAGRDQSPTAPAAPTRSAWDGVYTEAQAARGEEVYGYACARCHGKALEGKDDAGPLAGKEFMSGRTGAPLSALFTKINTRMPDDDPGSLSLAETADVLAYVLQANKLPAGKEELPTDVARLKLITFEAKGWGSHLAFEHRVNRRGQISSTSVDTMFKCKM
jgi:mono/diheme cytochrome c family protein